MLKIKAFSTIYLQQNIAIPSSSKNVFLLKLFVSLIFIQKPYQTPQISGTLITLVLAPCIYVRKIACLRERNAKYDPRKSPKSIYVFSSLMHCAIVITHYYEKDKL